MYVHLCSWRLIEAAADVPGAGAVKDAILEGQDYLTAYLGSAEKAGLTFVRFFAAADIDGGLEGTPLQTAPGIPFKACCHTWHCAFIACIFA